MEMRKVVLIVKLAHRRMDGWASLYALYKEYIQDPTGVDALELVVQEMDEYEKRLFSMGWKMIEPGQWMYFGQYRVEVAMTEAGLGLPVSEAANN